MEQEIASIIKFVLDSAGNPTPYYYNIPQNFLVPAAFFPDPDIDTAGDTLSTYEVSHVFPIKFFASTTEKAFDLASRALTAIKERRNLIPLVDFDGEQLDRGVRVRDPSAKRAGEGAVLLTIKFVSRRPYYREASTASSGYEVIFNNKAAYQSVTISDEKAEELLEELLQQSEEGGTNG